MLTGGMEDVYNPLWFGLNPSICLTLSLRERTGASHPHTSHPGLDSTALISVTQTSLLPGNISQLRSRLQCLRFFPPWWDDFIVVRMKNILLTQRANDPSYRPKTDSFLVIFSNRWCNRAVFRAVVNVCLWFTHLLVCKISENRWKKVCCSFPQENLMKLFKLSHSSLLWKYKKIFLFICLESFDDRCPVNYYFSFYKSTLISDWITP